jgi:hypothetical protein
LPGLMELIWPSAFVVQSIHVVARLGLADILGPEPRTIDELARATRVHAPSLKRVLRALTTVGVFAEDADGRLRHTSLSETLRADHPGWGDRLQRDHPRARAAPDGSADQS